MEITKTFSTPVTENNVTTLTCNIPLNCKTLLGIVLHSSKDEQLFRRGSCQVLLGTQILVEEGEPSRLLQLPLGASPRYIPVGEIPISDSNRRLVIRHTDTPSDAAPFSPHTLATTLFFR